MRAAAVVLAALAVPASAGAAQWQSFDPWLRPAAVRAVAAQKPPAWMHATLGTCRLRRPHRATCDGTLTGLPATYVFRVDGRRLTLLDVR